MNFIGTHPLNLIGKVAIITSASSSTGAAICRSLLNSNASVLGIDRDVPRHSTRSSRASHFQFLRCDATDPFLSGEILKAVKKSFGKEDIDFLINVAGQGEWKEDWEGMVGVLGCMAAKTRGLVLNVATGGEGEKEIIDSAKAACAQLKCEGIRCNVLVAHSVSDEVGGETVLDEDTKSALQEHMKEHEAHRKKGGYDVEKERELANRALFLCTAQGEGIKGALIGIDGSCAPF